MSESIGKFKCPNCGSDNVTLDPTNQTITCNVCGLQYPTLSIQYLPQEDLMSYPSAVSGTMKIVKAEEGYRKVTYQIFPHTHEEFKTIEKDIKELKNAVTQLDTKVEELWGISPKVVVIEEVPEEEAKHRVEEYFKEHKTADIEELMLNLKIPVQTLVKIIDDLKQEGKITAEEERKT